MGTSSLICNDAILIRPELQGLSNDAIIRDCSSQLFFSLRWTAARKRPFFSKAQSKSDQTRIRHVFMLWLKCYYTSQFFSSFPSITIYWAMWISLYSLSGASRSPLIRGKTACTVLRITPRQSSFSLIQFVRISLWNINSHWSWRAFLLKNCQTLKIICRMQNEGLRRR